MPNQFDRYVLRSFIVPWLLCLICVLGLYIVIDLFDNLGRFLDAPTFGSFVLSAARYYLVHSPLFLGRVMPFVTLLAVLIALARLAKCNELATLKACGISFQRTMAPLLAVSCLLAVLLAVDREVLVPRLSQTMQRVEARVAPRKPSHDLFLFDRQGRLFFIDTFAPGDRERPLRGVSVFLRRGWPPLPRRGADLNVFLYAETGTVKNGWLVLHDVVRSTEPFRSQPRFALEKTVAFVRLRTSLTIEQIRNREDAELQTVSEMRELYRIFPHTAQRLLVAIHSRLAFCLANVVLILVAVPYAFQEHGRSALIGVGLALVVALLYYAVAMFATYLGNAAVLPPVVAGWLPPAVFGCVGLYLFRSMPT